MQRYWKRTFPAPAIRARRRVETPAGAQAQVDWAEFPGAVLGDEVVDLVALIVTLSWSRKRAVVWARSKDMRSWQTYQMGLLKKLPIPDSMAWGIGSGGQDDRIGRQNRDQLEFFVCGSLRDLVPDDHILARVDRVSGTYKKRAGVGQWEVGWRRRGRLAAWATPG